MKDTGSEVNTVEDRDRQSHFQDPRRGIYSPKLWLFVRLLVSKAEISVSNFKFYIPLRASR